MRDCTRARVGGAQRTSGEVIHGVAREVRLLDPVSLPFGIRQRQTYVPVPAVPLFDSILWAHDLTYLSLFILEIEVMIESTSQCC